MMYYPTNVIIHSDADPETSTSPRWIPDCQYSLLDLEKDDIFLHNVTS